MNLFVDKKVKDCFLFLMTYRFGLPPERVWISVYEDDDETYAIWHKEVHNS